MSSEIASNIYLFPVKKLTSSYVTEKSRWFDDNWQFEPTDGGTRSHANIIWDFKLPNGDLFTDKKHKVLLDSAKVLLISLLQNPRDGLFRKPSGIGYHWTKLRYFIIWMIENNYRDFSELDNQAFEEFKGDLAEDKVNRKPEKPGKAQSLTQYLMPIMHITQQSPVLKGRIPIYSARDKPFGGKSAEAVANEIALSEKGKWPAVPDKIFLPVAETALKWVEEYSEDILLLQQRYQENYRPELGTSSAYTLSVKAIENFTFSGSPAWREPLGQMEHYVDEKKGGGYNKQLLTPVQDIRHNVELLKAACDIVIQAFVGLRISEVCGLQSGPLSDHGLPACVTKDGSLSGLNEIFYLQGRLFKTTTKSEECEWVIASRPKGSNYLPPVVQAITVLEKLGRHGRDLTGNKINNLFLNNVNKKSLMVRKDNVRKPTGESINKWMQNFVLHHCGLQKPYHVTSHQWRKNFARYVYQCDSTMIPAISLHYKHVSLAMTEQGYIGNDKDLTMAMQDAVTISTIEALTDLVGGKKRPRGKLMEIIRHKEIEVRFGNYSDEEKERAIEETVKSSSIRVHKCTHNNKEHGQCWYRPGTGNCSENCEFGGYLSLGPDKSLMSPTVCHICVNFIVNDDHKIFWEERLEKTRPC